MHKNVTLYSTAKIYKALFIATQEQSIGHILYHIYQEILPDLLQIKTAGFTTHTTPV